jgi:hypothetical protein
MTRHPFEVNRWWVSSLIGIAAALAIYLTYYVWHHITAADPRGDFSYFYTAAQAMTHGQDIYTAQPFDKPRPGYIYPPLIAFLYQPLTSLSVAWAARMSLLVNVSAIGLSLAFASKAVLERLGRKQCWQVVLAVAVIAALLSADKIKSELQMLQTNALITLGITLGLYFLDRKPFWAGAALGFALNIKYQAIALLLYLLCRKRFKTAGATVLWTLIWGFIPAFSVGLGREAHYLVQGFAGVLRLVGLNFGNDVANVEPISSGFSVSITSAAARFTESHGLAISPFLIAGIIAIVWLILLATMIRAHHLPVLAWPSALGQQLPPWDLLVAIEWVAVVASVLAFSPQTNMRHIVLTTLINVLGVAIAWQAKNKNRWIAIAGLAILWMGLNLPFGQRVDARENPIIAFSHRVGGPTWVILLATALIAWVGFSLASQQASPEAHEVPVDNAQAVPCA